MKIFAQNGQQEKTQKSKQWSSTLLKVRTQCKCRQRKCPQTTSSILVWKCRVELTVMRSGVTTASIGSQELS